MSKKAKPTVKPRNAPASHAQPRRSSGLPLWLPIAGAAVIGAAALMIFGRPSGTRTLVLETQPTNPSPSVQTSAVLSVPAPLALPPAALLAATNTVAPTNPWPEIEINKALMVTVELDFGPTVPTIAEALKHVERRYQPDDGQGRTFAILDAYGEPTPQGRLHMSMHVSMEKPGLGALVFRRTGETLWQSRIVAGTNTARAAPGGLLIYLDDGAGKTVTVDGSKNPATIMEATVKEAGVPVSIFWPDGLEREVTFLYSACGCPVKVMAKRTGDRTIRTKDLPVIFPDDPAVLAVLNRLMGWEKGVSPHY